MVKGSVWHYETVPLRGSVIFWLPDLTLSELRKKHNLQLLTLSLTVRRPEWTSLCVLVASANWIIRTAPWIIMFVTTHAWWIHLLIPVHWGKLAVVVFFKWWPKDYKFKIQLFYQESYKVCMNTNSIEFYRPIFCSNETKLSSIFIQISDAGGGASFSHV